jgi:hypothetical protein
MLIRNDFIQGGRIFTSLCSGTRANHSYLSSVFLQTLDDLDDLSLVFSLEFNKKIIVPIGSLAWTTESDECIK